jgi:hypothetical protein
MDTTQSEPLGPLDADDFRTLDQVLKGLPGVSPRVTRTKLAELRSTMGRHNQYDATLDGIVVSRVELREVFHLTRCTGYISFVVSPAGVLLVRLYQAGCL